MTRSKPFIAMDVTGAAGACARRDALVIIFEHLTGIGTSRAVSSVRGGTCCKGGGDVGFVRCPNLQFIDIPGAADCAQVAVF